MSAIIFCAVHAAKVAHQQYHLCVFAYVCILVAKLLHLQL
jgi:hypothetical protein